MSHNSNRNWFSPRRAALLLFAAMIFLGGRLAVAFNLWENGVGNEKRFADPPGNILYDQCSVSTGGSRFRAAVDNVVNWQKTGKLVNPISIGAGDNDCELSFSDDDSEFLYASPGEIDGDWGRTMSRTRTNGEIKAGDVVISTDLNPAPAPDPDTATSSVAGRASMLHEFGHFIGLDHDFGFLNIMRQSVKPLVPAHPGFVAVFPDDKNGALHHYEADVVGELNVFVSAQTFLPDLPQVNQDAYLAVFGDPVGAAGNVISYALAGRSGSTGTGNDWQIFNPDDEACTAFSNAGAPDCAALDGPFTVLGNDANPLLQLCPGDAFNVPYSLGSRSDPLDTPVDHQVGVYLGNNTTVSAATQIMLEDNERDVSTQGINARVDRVVLSNDPDCILPGDYRVWVVADTCEQLIEVNENTTFSKGSVLEQDNILRTAMRVRVLAADDAACAGGVSDGMCDNSGFREICTDPPATPPGEQPDFSDCSDPDHPDDPSVRGEPGCKCHDLEPLADVNEDGGFPDGAGSFLEVPFNSAGQYCFGSDHVCGDFNGASICQECGVDTNIGCPCFAQSECEGVEEGLRCWGADDEGWSSGSQGTCLPDGNDPVSREKLTEMPWFCLDGCASISPSGDPSATGCLYRQGGFNLLHGECVDVIFTPGILIAGQCEDEQDSRAQTSETVNLNKCGGEADLPGGDIVCKPECQCHSDCPALGFPDDYGCSLFIGTGGTSVGRCVPPECLNPKNDLIGLCQLFL